ncbi:MAG: universal stress protein, partial [Steroidobacteraceae bacterium]
MKAIEKVLAATDFSADADRAVARAARVAAEQGASLTLLHVVSRRALEAAAGLHGVPADFEARLVRDATDHLARLSLALPPTKKVLTSVKVGAPRKEIFEAANAADLLVLGVRGTNPVRDLLLGTTAERMVSKANLPILIVKRPSMDTYRRVLAPVDLSEQSATVLAAAARIAPSGKINAANAFVVPDGEVRVNILGAVPDGESSMSSLPTILTAAQCRAGRALIDWSAE